MAILLSLVALLWWLGLGLVALMAVVGTPVYVIAELVKLARARRRTLEARRRGAERELREQYAAGVLTLAGLEERVGTTMSATSHFELDSVLADLPPRRRPPVPVAVFETVAGVGLLLVLHGLAARGAGAALVLGALVPPRRWRPFASAFLAGLAALVAPLAAVALAVSAIWRYVRPSA